MLTRTYYTTQEQDHKHGYWKNGIWHYVQGTNIAAEFPESELSELLHLAKLSNKESNLDVRVIKVVETIDVVWQEQKELQAA